MKKTITVQIDIDTEVPGVSALSKLSDDIFKIAIRKDVIDAYGDGLSVVPIALTHELGHLVGVTFNLPAASRDPRSLDKYYSWLSILTDRSKQEAILASEREAWDVAELITHAGVQRHHALDSYMNVFHQGFERLSRLKR